MRVGRAWLVLICGGGSGYLDVRGRHDRGDAGADGVRLQFRLRAQAGQEPLAPGGVRRSTREQLRDKRENVFKITAALVLLRQGDAVQRNRAGRELALDQ